MPLPSFGASSVLFHREKLLGSEQLLASFLFQLAVQKSEIAHDPVITFI